jgi:hypothetical protein
VNKKAENLGYFLTWTPAMYIHSIVNNRIPSDVRSFDQWVGLLQVAMSFGKLYSILSRSFSTWKTKSRARGHQQIGRIRTLDWHEHLLVIVARVKAFFQYSKDKQDVLIRLTDAPSDAQAVHFSEGIEEAELDEAWDLVSSGSI